ncbi:hypothetical protein CRV01_04790 [Arcobacter sp. CECT 8983]|uniref:diguanylate cyclase n=1 Tax=Arcobacter sp. CECT 8983 TaxID=2044508 RepID=UPI00100A93DD|nr:diguanylate cyclase [Arcobacter sp. CECT 8983]RXJ90480.1 hypothetical protein CRV01_04790 [Arcobacter sp. CECT 8983]
MRKSDSIYWKHQLWIVIVSLAITYAFTYTALYDSLKNYFNDTVQYLSSEEKYFTDSVVIDVNDSSLKILQKDFGHWPYTRDKYALIIEFLQSMGVENIVFDIKFVDPRVGDNIFKSTITKYDNIFFVTSVLNEDIPVSLDEQKRLEQMAWSKDSNIPALKFSSLLLPNESVLSTNTIYKLGITAVSEDSDGVIRSIPLLYNVDSKILPSLLLRVKSPKTNIPKINYSSKTNELSLNNKTWNVDNENRVKLFYPKNANSIMSIPFYKISEVALNKKSVSNSSFFKDKTVFIGSSAFLSDRVNTPRGAMSGSYLLAIAYEALKNKQIVKTNNVLNFILLLIAVLFSFYLSSRKEIYNKKVLVVTSLTIVIVFVYGFISLKYFYLETNLFFSLLVIIFSIIFTVINYQLSLSKYNQKLIEETKKLYNEANCDTLTGLLNRRGFDEQYRKYKEIITKTNSSQTACLAVMDLDHFKSVNDTYGHDIGDIVLQKFGKLLKEHLRDIDVPARWGGEEFVILLRNTTIDESIIILNRVRELCKQMQIQTSQGELTVTISIGVTHIEDLNETIDLYVKKADIGLYQAKQNGRNRVCIS